MQVLAPAKINLSLRILGRRDDGLHEIETFIAPVSLYDEVTIEKEGKGINFQCDDPSVPTGEKNLVVRAANVFFGATKLQPAMTIKLKKRIPHGAGLGGGSSDAAATLLALNRVFETNLTREDLVRLASGIGSDVPFFLFESCALCRGRGEIVTRANLPEHLSILLLKPDFGVETPWAYSRWQASREIRGVNYSGQEFGGHRFINDLERPVFEKFVSLAQVKTWLLKQPEVGAALMSGSGSTMFAVLRNAQAADALRDRARKELDPELWTCACETL